MGNPARRTGHATAGSRSSSTRVEAVWGSHRLVPYRDYHNM
jgi:hypothetical protein